MAAIHELYKEDDQKQYDLQVGPNLLKKKKIKMFLIGYLYEH